MSLRDPEDLLAERVIDVTHGTVRCQADKFGPAIANSVRKVCGRADSARCSVSSPRAAAPA